MDDKNHAVAYFNRPESIETHRQKKVRRMDGRERQEYDLHFVKKATEFK